MTNDNFTRSFKFKNSSIHVNATYFTIFILSFSQPCWQAQSSEPGEPFHLSLGRLQLQVYTFNFVTPSCFLIFNPFRVSSNHGDSFKSKSLTIFCKLIGITRMTLYQEFEVLVAPFISTNMISSVLNKCTNLGFESISGEMQNY